MKKILYVVIPILFIVFVTLLLINNKPPTPTISFDEIEIPTVQASYCWNGFLGYRCVDTTSPPDLVKGEPVAVSPGTELKIDFKDKPKNNTIDANIWLDNERTEKVTVKNNILTTPTKSGTYVYDISAVWNNGESSYAFFIKVE